MVDEAPRTGRFSRTERLPRLPLRPACGIIHGIMDLRCKHCGERIVARGFGKCPGCYQDLPEELRLSEREKEHERMEEEWRTKQVGGGGDGGGPGCGSVF